MISRLAAVLTFIVGVMNLVSAATPAIADRMRLLETILPLQSDYGRLSAALAGVALIFLARGLWRRKRLAWVATVVVLAVSIVSHLVKGLDYEEAALSTAILLFLVATRGDFRARSDAPSVAQGIRVLAAAFAITLAYGTIGFFLLDRHFRVTYAFWPAARQTVVMFTQFYNPGLEPITGFGSYFAVSIYAVGAVTFGFGLVMLLRPVLLKGPASAADSRHARTIVETHGRTPLAPLALLPDKSYFFSSGGSVIAYRLVATVAVALGDPIGPVLDAPESIRAFRLECADNDWRPAFYQTLPDYLDDYRASGLSVLRIGHEAVVDAEKFSLSGKHFRVQRNLVNRLLSEGFDAVYHAAPQGVLQLRELREVSDAWLAHRGQSEMGFSVGWFDELYLRDCGIMTIEGPSGEVVAFSNILSEPAADGATIDLMRYRPNAPEGVMDFMFIRLIEWAKSHGFATFNLGFAALSGVGEQQDPAAEKALKLVYDYGNRFYGFKGLHGFKNKFRPEWQPRYLVYPEAADLPLVLAAIVRANSRGSGASAEAPGWTEEGQA